MISVISYGVGNLGSIFNMLRKIGVEAQAASTAEDIARAEKLILPGIGAFDHGMESLSERGLVEPLRRRVLEDRVPILGICLGMQLLGQGSEEGKRPGLSLVDARCVRFHSNGASALKIPHMGWKTLAFRQRDALTTQLDADSRFYFVHSYHVVCGAPEDVLATAQYGVEFTAMLHRDNVWGAQFHPEKSHRFGMTLLANFAGV